MRRPEEEAIARSMLPRQRLWLFMRGLQIFVGPRFVRKEKRDLRAANEIELGAQLTCSRHELSILVVARSADRVAEWKQPIHPVSDPWMVFRERDDPNGGRKTTRAGGE